VIFLSFNKKTAFCQNHASHFVQPCLPADSGKEPLDNLFRGMTENSHFVMPDLIRHPEVLN
jgi:hypothetical protein